MLEEALQKLEMVWKQVALQTSWKMGALYGTSKFFRASCGSELTDIGLDFLPTMENDRSQKSPDVFFKQWDICKQGKSDKV